MKRIFLWSALFLFAYASCEGLSYFGLVILEKVRGIKYHPLNVSSLTPQQSKALKNYIGVRSNYIKYSPTLGWTVRKKGPSMSHNANSAGIRSDREYELKPPQNVLRISAFGDSFTACDEVSNEDTWEAQMERLNPSREVLNFGVGAYGLDQAFLRYQQEENDFHPHITFIGYIGENIGRSVSVFRPFYVQLTSAPLTKPRFLLKGDKLELIKNPVQDIEQYNKLLKEPEEILPQLGLYDFHYQTKYQHGFFDFLPSIRLFKIIRYNLLTEKIFKDRYYNESSEAFLLTIKIFSEFYHSVLRKNSLPIILVFPSKPDLQRFTKDQTKLYAPMIRFFEENGLAYIDLTDAFIRYFQGKEIDDLFMPAGHYSPEANKIVALYLDYYLKKEGLTDKQKITKKKKEATGEN